MKNLRGVTRSARGRLAIVTTAAIAISGSGIATAVVAAQAGAAGPGASPAAVSGPLAYVTRSDSSVGKVSLATQQKIGTPIELDGEPQAIAITPDGSKAYVTQPSMSQAMSITTADESTTPIFVSEGEPRSVATSPDGALVYLTDSADDLAIVDASDDEVIDTIDFDGPDANGIAVSPDGSTLWVSTDYGEGGGQVKRIDFGEGYSITDIEVGYGPDAIAVTPDGSLVYVANRWSDTITKITTADNSTEDIYLPYNTEPSALAISPDGSKVYVAGYGNGTLTTITTADDTVSDQLWLGGAPSGIAITPDGDFAYVTSRGNFPSAGVAPHGGPGTTNPSKGPKIFVVDTDGFSIVKKIAMSGVDPNAIAITPDQAPVARLSVAPGPTGEPSEFDASASTSESSPIVSYAWDFGDGDTAVTGTPTTTHVYDTASDYTVTVTLTDAAGTSTEKVFTGQTMSRNGGPSAVATRDIEVTECPADEECSATVSDGEQIVNVSGTSSTEATFALSIGVATVACQEGETPKPREVIGLNPENFTPAPGGGLNVSIEFTDVHVLKKIAICYVSPKPFRTLGGTFALSGLIPHCHGDVPSLPCKVGEEMVGDNEVVNIIVPATDPKFWAKQKVTLG